MATASHVINNRGGNMTAETRERVLEAIRQVGYRPGVIPGGDTARRAQTIGVFVFLGAAEKPLSSNPYAVQVLDGILATAMPLHWNVTLISVHAWEDARTQVRLFADGRCDGFILVAPRAGWQIKEALIERGYPCVLVNAGRQEPNVDTVDVDNLAAAREMTAHLIQLGHRNIAFLPGGEDLADTLEREQGFKAAFADAGLPEQSARVLRPGSYDFNQSVERIRYFLRERANSAPCQRPTALFCGNDQLAMWAREIMREQQIDVPGEISLVGFDDLPDSARMEPPLTTIRQPRHSLGVRATQILLNRIAHGPQGNTDQSQVVADLLPYELVLRESVANRELPSGEHAPGDVSGEGAVPSPQPQGSNIS